ncbi:RluA family pseudouridine synthase [Waterburya agarophytonicola K14]|uniref:Pseudouridine synthase n=1 Tax=Waterburya agarophytonicola KI4 TaxID=2874699 RepID=A0A964BP18_9CYAN|nr:RluA family pseudouridine synthase [Waterburya agarophytonicola]MCC0176181.1 RluA family pseudouridine synthase [Waterburya agarophytonicola KI4]
MNNGWIYRDQVKDVDAGKTILDYYTQKYRHSSQEQWQVRIESREILLNNIVVSSDTILQAGDNLIYHRSPWREPEVPLHFEVLYEDRDLLVINKPSGLPVMPGGGFLEHTLLSLLKQKYPQDTPVPIHRLGRGTSGLMLLGRSPLGKSSLARQMRRSTIGQDTPQLNKVYRVLVQKNSISDRLTIEQPIGKISHPVLGYLYGATDRGKYAHSQSKVIERYPNHTLVEVTIFTGRPHQIRIHMAAAGYPLVGDPLYIAGGTFAPITKETQSIPVPGDCGYFLHAYQLSFIHPRSQQKQNFKCSTPDNWDD